MNSQFLSRKVQLSVIKNVSAGYCVTPLVNALINRFVVIELIFVLEEYVT